MAENVKTVQGLAIASVKTLQGLAIASAKTILGVDNTGGSPSWTYSREVADLDTSNAGDPSVYLYQAITLTAGTASKLSIYSSSCGVGDVKIALYDGSKNLLESVTVTSPGDSAAHDLEGNISNTSVSNGTYYVGFCPSAATQDFNYDAGAGTRLYKVAVLYANFPNDPIAEDGSQSNSHRAGVYITP